jgi:hypothetical protein
MQFGGCSVCIWASQSFVQTWLQSVSHCALALAVHSVSQSL